VVTMPARSAAMKPSSEALAASSAKVRTAPSCPVRLSARLADSISAGRPCQVIDCSRAFTATSTPSRRTSCVTGPALAASSEGKMAVSPAWRRLSMLS